MVANYVLSCSASGLPLERCLDINLAAMPTCKRLLLRVGYYGPVRVVRATAHCYLPDSHQCKRSVAQNGRDFRQRISRKSRRQFDQGEGDEPCAQFVAAAHKLLIPSPPCCCGNIVQLRVACRIFPDSRRSQKGPYRPIGEKKMQQVETLNVAK